MSHLLRGGLAAAITAVLLAVGLAVGPGLAQTPRIDCANFQATSPLDGMNWGTQRFHWDAAPGAARYRLDVFDHNLRLVARARTDRLNISVDTGPQHETGSLAYTWYVVALDADDNERCRTDAVVTRRGAAPDGYLSRNVSSTVVPPPPPAPPPRICDLSGDLCLEGIKSIDPLTCEVTCFTCAEVLGFPDC